MAKALGEFHILVKLQGGNLQLKNELILKECWILSMFLKI